MVSVVSSWAYATVAAFESFNLKWNSGSKVNLYLDEQILTSSVAAGSCAGGFPGTEPL